MPRKSALNYDKDQLCNVSPVLVWGINILQNFSHEVLICERLVSIRKEYFLSFFLFFWSVVLQLVGFTGEGGR